MAKPKYIIFSGAFGFVMSFFISIISTHRFGRSLLRGVIFGVVFAVLMIGLDLLMKKFLGVEESSGGESNQSAGPVVGSKIDISLNDENLSDNGENLKFFVANNKHQLEKEARTVIKAPSSEPVVNSSESSGSSASAFKPVNLGEQLDQFPGSSGPVGSGSNSSRTETGFSGGSVSPTAPSAVSDIDALPDIGGFGDGLGDVSSRSSDSMDSVDTDFSSGSSSSYSSSRSSEDRPIPSGDTELIAKAISTALKRDDE